MRSSDILIHNGTVVTVDQDFTVIENGALTISNGRIENIWSIDDAEMLPSAKETVDAEGGIIMPGLINAHTHLPMSLFRGLADDMALDRWLNEHMFPAEARHVSEKSVSIGTMSSVAEMLLGGTTACCDGYFYSSHIAAAVDACGMRAVLGQGVIDFPAPGVPNVEENVAVARAYAESWLDRSPLVRPSIFCHSPYACSAETLQAAKAAADELGVLFQIHVAETQSEAEDCRSANGCSPVANLQRLGVLDEKTVLIHMVWVDTDDIQRVSDTGAVIVHCPESNMKLASGVAPVPDFMDAGIPVGLGTDGCASNNDLSMFGEMDTAAKLHKVHRLDPTVMDAAGVLRMATVQGARILGLEDDLGSLEAGKLADLIVVDTRRPHLTPMYHPASHLVYAASASDVRHVMVEGRWVVRQRQLQTIDWPHVLQAAEALGQQIGRSGQVDHRH